MQRLKRFVLSLILALSLLGSALVASPSSHLLADAARALHGFVSTQTTVSTHAQLAGWWVDGHAMRSEIGNRLLATGGGGDPGSGG